MFNLLKLHNNYKSKYRINYSGLIPNLLVYIGCNKDHKELIIQFWIIILIFKLKTRAFKWKIKLDLILEKYKKRKGQYCFIV